MIRLSANEGVDLEIEYGAALSSYLASSTQAEKSAVVRQFLSLLVEGERPVVLWLFNNIASPTLTNVPHVLTFSQVKSSFMRGQKL